MHLRKNGIVVLVSALPNRASEELEDPYYSGGWSDVLASSFISISTVDVLNVERPYRISVFATRVVDPISQ
jgi:hypothetical protein